MLSSIYHIWYLLKVCLFNISGDPCEFNNLLFKFPDVIRVGIDSKVLRHIFIHLFWWFGQLYIYILIDLRPLTRRCRCTNPRWSHPEISPSTQGQTRGNFYIFGCWSISITTDLAFLVPQNSGMLSHRYVFSKLHDSNYYSNPLKGQVTFLKLCLFVVWLALIIPRFTPFWLTTVFRPKNASIYLCQRRLFLPA